MKPLEANKFYESERKNIVVSHADFAIDDTIDYREEKIELNDFLSSKNWNEVLTAKTLFNELKTINFIFEECLSAFSNKIDSVELFSLIVDFYDLDYNQTFRKLVLKNRLILVNSLNKNLNINLLNINHKLLKSSSTQPSVMVNPSID
jgi:hypothetical protein